MNGFLCELSKAAGRDERCPGEACPFWADDRCSVAGLKADLACNAGLTDLLLELRDDLKAQSPRSTFRLFHPPGLA